MTTNKCSICQHVADDWYEYEVHRASCKPKEYRPLAKEIKMNCIEKGEDRFKNFMVELVQEPVIVREKEEIKTTNDTYQIDRTILLQLINNLEQTINELETLQRSVVC